MRSPGKARGFTLIELILMIVVFFGSVVALLSVSINAAQRVGENKDSALALQLAQEQAELVLAVRRSGYNNVSTQFPSATAVSVPGYSGYSRSVAVTICTATQQTTWGLSNGCEIVDIRVTNAAATQTLATVTLLLANYQ